MVTAPQGQCRAPHSETALVKIIIKAEDGNWGGRSVRLVLSLLCPFSILIALEKKENHKALKALILPALHPPRPLPDLGGINSHLSKCKSAIKTQTAKCQR